MNGEKLMLVANILLLLSIVGQTKGMKYFSLLTWIIALILLFRESGSKFMKGYYVLLITVLLFMLVIIK